MTPSGLKTLTKYVDNTAGSEDIVYTIPGSESKVNGFQITADIGTCYATGYTGENQKFFGQPVGEIPVREGKSMNFTDCQMVQSSYSIRIPVGSAAILIGEV